MMDPRPRPQSTVLFKIVFKIVAALLLALNVSMHGLVALFIGGPFGLGAYLLLVVVIWVSAWVTLRRWHDAGAD